MKVKVNIEVERSRVDILEGPDFKALFEANVAFDSLMDQIEYKIGHKRSIVGPDLNFVVEAEGIEKPFKFTGKQVSRWTRRGNEYRCWVHYNGADAQVTYRPEPSGDQTPGRIVKATRPSYGRLVLPKQTMRTVSIVDEYDPVQASADASVHDDQLAKEPCFIPLGEDKAQPATLENSMPAYVRIHESARGIVSSYDN